jgi:MATE family multidrug resistance protein
MWGFIPSLWIVNLRGFVTAFERPRAATVIATAAVLFNALVGYLLITGTAGFPQLGLAGVGAATAATNILQCVALMVFVSRDRRFRRYHVLSGAWRSDWPRLREMADLGLPIAGTLLLEMCLFAAGAFEMGWISDAALSAHQIALQCVSVVFTVPLALGAATTVRVGLAAGAGDLATARRCGLIALSAAAAYSVVTAAAFLGAPQLIVRWLAGADAGPDIVSLAVTFLGIGALFQLFDSSQAVMLGALRGLKDTAVPLIIAVACYLGLGITSSLWLGFRAGFGGTGVWLGLAVGLATTATLFALRFLRLTRANVPGRPGFSADRAVPAG